MLIGVTGEARAGKDTLVRHLCEHYGFTRYAFADGVRRLALAADPFIRDEGAACGSCRRLSDIVAEVGWERAKDEHPEVRRFLQAVGTEGVRDIVGADSWVRATAALIEADGGFAERGAAITDVRFPNEAEWVHASGGKVLGVVRVGVARETTDGHVSETNVAELLDRADAVFTNVEGDPGAMLAQLDAWLARPLAWPR